MLVLILTDVKYLQNVAFSFEKSWNSRNHSSDSHQLIKNSLPSKISHHAPTQIWEGGGYSKICTLSERLLALAMEVHTCSTCSWNNDKIPKS